MKTALLLKSTECVLIFISIYFHSYTYTKQSFRICDTNLQTHFRFYCTFFLVHFENTLWRSVVFATKKIMILFLKKLIFSFIFNIYLLTRRKLTDKRQGNIVAVLGRPGTRAVPVGHTTALRLGGFLKKVNNLDSCSTWQTWHQGCSSWSHHSS